MKIKESQLRTIIRNVLKESLFNDKVQHTTLEDVMCRCYILTPEIVNASPFVTVVGIALTYEFAELTINEYLIMVVLKIL